MISLKPSKQGSKSLYTHQNKHGDICLTKQIDDMYPTLRVTTWLMLYRPKKICNKYWNWCMWKKKKNSTTENCLRVINYFHTVLFANHILKLDAINFLLVSCVRSKQPCLMLNSVFFFANNWLKMNRETNLIKYHSMVTRTILCVELFLRCPNIIVVWCFSRFVQWVAALIFLAHAINNKHNKEHHTQQ